MKRLLSLALLIVGTVTTLWAQTAILVHAKSPKGIYIIDGKKVLAK
ncbi:MAG: hypothetical protein IK144_08005 [Bacteroidaceae bacterium]|nr:hypothetical protein [Bacteroidaceae bacterium]